MPTEETVITAELAAAYDLIRKLWRRPDLHRVQLTEQEQITLKAAIEAGER